MGFKFLLPLEIMSDLLGPGIYVKKLSFPFLCSREVWPEGDVFGSPDISPEEEIQLLKEILYAPLPRECPVPSACLLQALFQHQGNADPVTFTFL